MNRREFLRRIGGVVGGVILGRAGSRPKAHPRIGINLAGIADWNTELPFVDVFRMSRPWISQRKGARWGGGPPLQLDSYGWVKRLEPDCWAETLLCTIEGGHYPSGIYTVWYEGEGRIGFGNAARILSTEPGRIRIQVDAKKGAIFLRLYETNPKDPIRNIRVILPGREETYQTQPWNPSFLRRWSKMACLRFMDWMKTNGSMIRHWSDRPVSEDATFSRRGVPVEWMVDLCNRIGAAPWFCMPHQADDDFVRRFAEVVKARLDPKLSVYVEYSNEVWNSMFAQHRYAAEQGQKLGFSNKPWEAAWRFTAYRSIQIFRIWEEVFGGTERLVRVLPSQAANPYVSKQILSFQDAYKNADALGIGPYISMIITPDRKPKAEEVASWSVDQVLDYVEKVALPRSIEWIRRQKQVADAYGLRLVAYEAGQHLVGAHGAENNAKLTERFHLANRHPRMGEVYRRYLQAWVEQGGDLSCHFSSVSRWSKWGSWGLLEYADQDPATSPKYQAVMEWVRRLNR